MTSNLIEDVGHPRANGYPCICPECVGKRAYLQRGGSVNELCTRDHCTPEERALINAVLERCGSIRRNQLDGELEIYAIIDAAEALLAARAGKEER